jgi:hypothetical protein
MKKMHQTNKSFSPREFLKERRPEKFSDSATEEVPALDRSLLEYHLDTLTSRSQETIFENFARRLAQCEVCPNLLPHTGPTGGGDSKVDSETYPVADALSLTWFAGIGREAAHERWAFAFSATKKWRPKLQSDIAKIASTGREYCKAIFISNQYIADRVRAEVEDELSKKHGFDVRVFDRTWILDKVFSGHHETIAIDELKMQTSIRVQHRKGPLDLEKESELEAVELRIKKASEQGRADGSLVADCLEAAELARGLELSRTEIEGRLLRAQRVANECGTTHQQLLSAYQWAWTAFWWFEDYKTFSKHYTEVEKSAIGSKNAYDLELLFNLWCGLRMATGTAKLTLQDVKFDDRTRVLIAELDSLKHEQERASNALHAESLHLLMELITCPPEKSDPLLKNFEDIIDRCDGLVGFPLEPLVHILTEFCTFLDKSPVYDKLHEKIVGTVSKRNGEVAAARLLLQRGARLLDSGQPYQAIQSLGKALRRLYKHESRNDLVKALYLCGNAYEQVGLKWAAHGTVLTAASIAVNDFWKYEEITPAQAACFKRLKWFELRLGRLPHSIVWHENATLAQIALHDQGYDLKSFLEDEVLFDTCLAILLLKSDLWQLKQMVKLPQALEQIGLPISAATLKFALGHDSELPNGLGVHVSERLDFFRKLRNQPAALEMPELPLLYNERKITLTSQVLGCNIFIEADNLSPCIELAESTLAAIEALLSTGMEHHLFAREPVLNIIVRKSDFVAPPFEYKVEEREGRPFLEITTAVFHAHKMSHEAQRELKDKLIKLLVHILADVFVIDVSEQSLQKLFCDELALDRSVDFTSSFVTLGNVLGYTPKTNLDSWIKADSQEFPVKRSEEWDAAERKAKTKAVPNQASKITKGTGEPPPSLWQGKSSSHTNMKTVSMIRLALWDRANWTGTLFVWPENNESPPLLALLFKNAEAGAEIFKHWQNELGKIDKQDRLRLTIIRGISKKNVHAYRMVVGSNPDASLTIDATKLFFMVNRSHTMEPTSDRNLSGFLAKYDLAKAFFLAPAFLRDDSSEPEPNFEKCILKRELNVRQAWEIGRNDIDCPGIRDDDEPIIPEGHRDAPVLSVIQWLKECNQFALRSSAG